MCICSSGFMDDNSEERIRDGCTKETKIEIKKENPQKY